MKKVIFGLIIGIISLTGFSVYGMGKVIPKKTSMQAERNMHEAIEMHVQGLLEDKLPIPKSRSFAEYVAVQ